MWHSLIILCSISILFLSSCEEPTAPSQEMADAWCTCNDYLVPLVDQLQTASTAGDRLRILDSMELKGSKFMECMGGEEQWVKIDQQLNDQQKKKFNEAFNRIREEKCPKVFKAFAVMEEAVANTQN